MVAINGFSYPAARLSAAVPLALFLPGATLLLAVDPWHTFASGSERWLWSVLGSVAIAVGGGLVLNVTAGLTQVSWSALLFGVVAVAATTATVRRAYLAASPVTWRRKLGRRGVSVRNTFLSLGAALLLGGALALSVYSSATTDQEHFVELWVLPIPANAGSTATHARVGVTNDEGRELRFDVSITSAGALILSRTRIALKQGQSWTYRLARKRSATVRATVALASQPGHILDSVTLDSPVT